MLKRHIITNHLIYCTQGELRNAQLEGANLLGADLKMAKGV
jgi:uncharacterized protein YjbI with pentapeptide repeats